MNKVTAAQLIIVGLINFITLFCEYGLDHFSMRYFIVNHENSCFHGFTLCQRPIADRQSLIAEHPKHSKLV